MSEINSIDAAIGAIDEQITTHRNASQKLLIIVIFAGLLILTSGVSIYFYQSSIYSQAISTFSSGLGIGIGGGINPSTENSNKPIQSFTDRSLKEGNSNGATQNTDGNSSMASMSGMNGVEAYQGGGFSLGMSGGGGVIPNEGILYVFVALFTIVFGVLMAVYRFHLSEISRSEQNRLGLHRVRIAANNHDKEGFNTEVRVSLTKGAFDFSTGKEKKLENPLPGHPTSDISTLLTNKLLDAIDVKVSPKA